MAINPEHQDYYLSVQLEEIPWQRMIHWYGRATDYLEVFQQLLEGTAQARALIQKISNEIEHQDGIMGITPFALIFLCRTLPVLTSEDQQFLREKISIILQSAQEQLDFYEEDNLPQTVIKPQDLVKEPYLWPEFISEDEDKALWEQFEWGDEHYFWSIYSLEIVETYFNDYM